MKKTLIESIEQMQALPAGTVFEFQYGNPEIKDKPFQDAVAQFVMNDNQTFTVTSDDALPWTVGHVYPIDEGDVAAIKMKAYWVVEELADATAAA